MIAKDERIRERLCSKDAVAVADGGREMKDPENTCILQGEGDLETWGVMTHRAHEETVHLHSEAHRVTGAPV